jgi:hypothetical protein|nr:hypothetical protein [uncultured Steroidobacter sp.]
MEFLLLWWDNLDDALHAARHEATNIVGFLLAFALFALTGFALVLAPQATLAAIGLMLSASLYDYWRRRRAALANDD